MSAAPVHPPASPERDALDRIIRSEVLDRAPNLVLFLRYVCEMKIAGRDEAIKEYNIAVEALGRGSEFDQKRDSIVRVEAHRLRKRLAEYYRTAGAHDPVEILLPSGSYVPVFRNRDDAAAASPADAVAEGVLADPPQKAPRQSRPAFFSWTAAVGVVAVGLGALLVFSTGRSTGANTTPPARMSEVPFPAALPRAVLRISAGGTRDVLADSFGQLWRKDAFFEGGEVAVATPRSIRRALDPALYLTRRQGDFVYHIPAAPGAYELRLHFAETVFGEDNVAGGGEASRIFQVRVNDGRPWQADIVSEASGPNIATIRIVRGVRPAADGLIHISFQSGRKEAAFVNAIELLPSPNGLMLPVRIVARPSPVSTSDGQEWGADRFWAGGQTVQRPDASSGPEPAGLFTGERYGNFSYAIPVALDSTYSLTLRFAETWFGEGRPGGGGAGSRIFDVYCNGRTLLKNFDVLREAGGPVRQIRKTFRGLQPNAQGKLHLEFIPVRNYGMINAIEVTDEGR